MELRKLVSFLGDSLSRLQDFPEDARRAAGREIDRVQLGREPADWKPMPTIGKGVREIRVKERAGAFRVIYVANIGSKIYVLHAFQKKTQKTAQRAIDLAIIRFRQIGKE
jgi:phage-related protein